MAKNLRWFNNVDIINAQKSPSTGDLGCTKFDIGRTKNIYKHDENDADEILYVMCINNNQIIAGVNGIIEDDSVVVGSLGKLDNTKKGIGKILIYELIKYAQSFKPNLKYGRIGVRGIKPTLINYYKSLGFTNIDEKTSWKETNDQYIELYGPLADIYKKLI